VSRRRCDVGETVNLHEPARTVEAVIREVTPDGYRVSERGRLGWKATTIHVVDRGPNQSRTFIVSPKERPTDEQRRAARVAVDRAIAKTLDGVPCFCAPERPELGRPDYCLKHVVMARLDRDALAAEVQKQTSAGG
jgi:hypothetical protein